MKNFRHFWNFRFFLLLEFSDFLNDHKILVFYPNDKPRSALERQARGASGDVKEFRFELQLFILEEFQIHLIFQKMKQMFLNINVKQLASGRAAWKIVLCRYLCEFSKLANGLHHFQ